MARLLLPVLSVLTVLLLATSARAQSPDPRDYEVGYFVPSKTTIINAYLRHQSGTKLRNYSADVGVLRATYILKLKNVVITPLDVLLPVVDQRAYVPLSSTLAAVNPAFAAIPSDLNLTLHAAGLGDVVFLPTIGHGVTQDATRHTHTWYALTTYITAPTGKYDPNRLLNVGQNRWIINPMIVLGQRFMRAVTLEAMANVAFYRDNDEFRVPTMALAGTNLTLSQKPSFGFAFHLAIDLHPSFYVGTSYFYASSGSRDFTIPTTEGETTRNEMPGGVAVQTIRLNFGVRITPTTLLLAQWNEDVAGTESAPLGRFFGFRISQALVPAPKPAPASTSPEPEPARH